MFFPVCQRSVCPVWRSL